MIEEAKGKSFKEFPFGFNSEEDFIAATDRYIYATRMQLASRLEGMQGMSEHAQSIVSRETQRCQEELIELEERRKDPTALYNQVKGIYETVITLEKQGLSQWEIGKQFIDDGLVDKVLPINGLLESGIGQDWGYHLMQAVLVAKMVRASIRTPNGSSF